MHKHNLAREVRKQVMKEPSKSNPVATSKVAEQKFSMGRVAELIRVHVSTVSRLMNSGKLGYYQIGRRRVVGAGHLEQYLSDAERQAKRLLRTDG
jgi:excisionase family DNA binding protein